MNVSRVQSTCEERFDVLLVDDSPVDTFIVEEVLASIENVRLHVIRSGVDALAFLHRTGGFAEAPRPRLVLLDINMPRMNGHEVLARIRADSRFAGMRVVMLTSSKAPADVDKAVALGADDFVTKPAGYHAFAETIRQVIGHEAPPNIDPRGMQ